jgi:hypothetical protein
MFNNKIMCVTITGFSYGTSSTISFCLCLIFLLQKFVALAMMFTVHCQVVKMQVIRTASPHNHNDQASIWQVYLGTNFCHINQLWKQYDNYSLSLLYNAQLLVDLERLPLVRIPH